MISCPTCGDEFDKDRFMKTHHKLSHGESICKNETSCDIPNCENSFKYYPSEKDGRICPTCVKNGKNSTYLDDYVGNTVTYVEVDCHQCGDSIVLTKTQESEHNFCDESCVNDFHSDRMMGENNPRYVDGNSSGRKYDASWREVRSDVVKRDNNECVICGSPKNIHVHHIIPVREFDIEKNAHYKQNGVTVCASCHRKLEYGKVEIPNRLYDSYNLEEFNGEHL